MLNVLAALAFGLSVGAVSHRFLSRSLSTTHPAAAFGLSGLVGLGAVGVVYFMLGLRSTGLVYILNVIGVAGLWVLFGSSRKLLPFRSAPTGLEWLAVLAVAFACFVGLVNVLAPSVMSDWDTIAYHLAVPKIWLADGQIHPISYIHHSNFPGTVDMLFMWGLQWGGQAGAKAFTLVYFLFGAMAIFGLARERYGRAAACWSVAAFSTIPVAVWETGTGYIDVAHGLYAGLGAWVLFLGLEASGRRHDASDGYDSSRGLMVVGGLLLGFAAGSKYTGLQALIGVGVVALVVLILRSRRVVRTGAPEDPDAGRSHPAATSVALAALAAIVVCAPWYVRNVAWTGNPVYPFFFERFGGKHWTQKQADVYRNEQSTFGVPREGVLALPHAILGLAYQPGRYINPGQKLEVVNGQPQGATGNPLGAIGAPVMAALVLGLLYWRKLGGTDPSDPPQGHDSSPAPRDTPPPFHPRPSTLAEPATLAWILIGLLMWAMLSQQSRYMLSFAPPLCIMLGALVVRVQAGKVLAGLVVLQGLWTAYLSKEMLVTTDRVRVAFGATDSKEYLRKSLPFYEVAEYLNEQKTKRVALFDEVFGFYLDVPYFWAGFGHTDEMGYESMQTTDDFVGALKKLGIDRIYVSTTFMDRAFRDRWLAAMGLTGGVQSLPEEERAELIANPEARWRPLLAEAVLEGKIVPEKPFRGGLVFRLNQ